MLAINQSGLKELLRGVATAEFPPISPPPTLSDIPNETNTCIMLHAHGPLLQTWIEVFTSKQRNGTLLLVSNQPGGMTRRDVLDPRPGGVRIHAIPWTPIDFRRQHDKPKGEKLVQFIKSCAT
jgi:hypothetical protein